MEQQVDDPVRGARQWWGLLGFAALVAAVAAVGAFAVTDPATELVFNAAWTPLFFGAGRYGLAFAEIVVLWLLIALTTALFWRISRVAALLMLPYWAWVTFAAALNLAIWRLNS